MGLLDVLKLRRIRRQSRRGARIGGVDKIDQLEIRLLLTAPTLTDSEQYMLELINRARANPAAEAARYSIGLNDGVPSADTISTSPKQPLAPQQQLGTAAALHSQDMLDRDFFDHTTLGSGTSFDERVTNQGYIWNLVAENIGYAAKTITASQTVYMDEIHAGLIRSAGHRENIMLTELEEVGIGARFGAFKPENDPTTYQSTEMVTVNFGSRNLDPYITGVVYTDANDNHFYTIGESIRSGTVTAVNVASGVEFSDTIGVSGAYGFVVPAGTYIVTATFPVNGTSRTFRTPGNVVVGTNNVKVDFETNSGTLVSGALTIQSVTDTLNENGATTSTILTVTRSGSTLSRLIVNLSSSDTSEVSVPSNVEIPAGQTSATFTVFSVNDSAIDGTQTATITASATGGVTSDTLELTVVDRTFPALPSGTQTAATPRPTFTWTAVSNATSYEIWVNNITTGESRVVSITNISTTSYTTPVDLPIATYRVWVRGFTSGGQASLWSPGSVWNVRPATTINDSGRTVANSDFTITWQPITGASAYDVWIDRPTSSTVQYLRNVNVSGNSLEVSNFDIGTYRIWVRGKNSAGDLSAWSSAALINVNYAPVNLAVVAADLAAPATLTWSTVVGALQYEVWINNLTTGSSAAIHNTSVSGTSLALNSASTASYRAWVRARDLNGSFYTWSSPFDFEIGRASRVISPSGPGHSVRPVISWTTVAGATRYEVWITNLSTGLRQISETNLTSTSYIPTADLTSGVSYRTWIRAFDSSGSGSAWSLSLTFTVASNVSASPGLRHLSVPDDEPVLDRVFASAHTWLHEPESDRPPAPVAYAESMAKQKKPHDAIDQIANTSFQSVPGDMANAALEKNQVRCPSRHRLMPVVALQFA